MCFVTSGPHGVNTNRVKCDHTRTSECEWECDSHFTSFVFATVSAYESKITCMNTSEILCVMSLGCESNTKLFGHLITNSNTQNHKRFDPHISFPNFVVRDWRKVTDPADHKYPQFVITWKGDSHSLVTFVCTLWLFVIRDSVWSNREWHCVLEWVISRIVLCSHPWHHYIEPGTTHYHDVISTSG